MRDPKSLAGRPTQKADQLGQIFTPPLLAVHMARELLRNRPADAVCILDPCVGPFTFPKAIATEGFFHAGDHILAIDIDPSMLLSRSNYHELDHLDIDCISGDYLTLPVNKKYDYAILNPPYIRQEWIDQKEKYQSIMRREYGLDIPGTSNLYLYFIVKAIQDLKPNGRFAAIIYDSWQSTLYGRWLSKYLEHTCQELTLDTATRQPFNGRLIDATILFGTRGESTNGQKINYGVSSLLKKPTPLSNVEGFSQIESLFATQRGLRLKQADFFLCDLEEYSHLGATPFLKKVAKLNGVFQVPDTHPEAALLVHSVGSSNGVLSTLTERIEEAQRHPKKNVSILTWFREQPETWFLHRKAPVAPLIFNYYLRKRPRHIHNPNRAYSDNFYGLTPHFDNAIAWLAVLNSSAVCTEILAHSRNQGNGLAKIQLFEYRQVLAPAIHKCTSKERNDLCVLGQELIDNPQLAEQTLRKIDGLLASIFSNVLLQPSVIQDLLQQIDFQARQPKDQ